MFFSWLRPGSEKWVIFALAAQSPQWGFFNLVIPIHNFVQSRNPEGYFWHHTSRAYFQSRISLLFYFKIPNPEHQIREITYPLYRIHPNPSPDPSWLRFSMQHRSLKESHEHEWSSMKLCHHSTICAIKRSHLFINILCLKGFSNPRQGYCLRYVISSLMI